MDLGQSQWMSYVGRKVKSIPLLKWKSNLQNMMHLERVDAWRRSEGLFLLRKRFTILGERRLGRVCHEHAVARIYQLFVKEDETRIYACGDLYMREIISIHQCEYFG